MGYLYYESTRGYNKPINRNFPLTVFCALLYYLSTLFVGVLHTIMDIQSIPAVRPVAGLLANNDELLQQAQAELSNLFGPVFSASVVIPFTYTKYYGKEMGSELLRQFLVFSEIRAPDDLADWKIASNAWEKKLGCNEQGGRRVNIDPGYLAPGKLVLASTKDHEHRIYLQKGIYAEVTLRVRDKHFCTWDWSYPDYAEAADFFEAAYVDYLRKIANKT
ncbi:DUF4416 family protein [bacterium]|nr:DUF4416 family protein [bacterium]